MAYELGDENVIFSLEELKLWNDIGEFLISYLCLRLSINLIEYLVFLLEVKQSFFLIVQQGIYDFGFELSVNLGLFAKFVYEGHLTNDVGRTACRKIHGQ